jgi:hypothetical protein
VSDMLFAADLIDCMVMIWYMNGIERLTRRIAKYINDRLGNSAKGMFYHVQYFAGSHMSWDKERERR